MRFESGLNFLNEQGLNLVAVFDCQTLPHPIQQSMLDQDIPLTEYQRLVLTGNGGGNIWQALQTFGMQTDHPVDYFSIIMTKQFIDDFLDQAPSLMLYPEPYFIPLQQLGALAGWHHPSPLGIGINNEFGLWFAYRTAFLTKADLPLWKRTLGPSPCDMCISKPCITVCPGQAVVEGETLHLNRCSDYRLQIGSACTDRCLSRLACPVATEHRYPLEQTLYHYRYSLESLKRWIENNPSQ